MNFKQFIKKERQLWHDRFFPGILAALAIAILAFFFEFSGHDIVLLTSIAASIAIITHKHPHKLVILGTTYYSYFLAIVIGFILFFIKQKFIISLPILIFIGVLGSLLIIYALNFFHPPAIGITVGIIIYGKSIFNLFIILALTLLLFFLLKILMYFYYNHLDIRKFKQEFKFV
ncbi:MAG: hypothetical protein KAT77_06140 [Nanoarchaeota archaeon]|nr:hypothetical protein [Nanoarchaeota archaeon]